MLSVLEASQSQLCPDGPCVHLSGPAYIPSCIAYVQKSDLHLINVFCVVIVVKKCTVNSPGSLFVLYCIAATYLCCLRPKLQICTACCSDSQIIASLEECLEEELLTAKLSQNRVVQLMDYGC